MAVKTNIIFLIYSKKLCTFKFAEIFALSVNVVCRIALCKGMHYDAWFKTTTTQFKKHLYVTKPLFRSSNKAHFEYFPVIGENVVDSWKTFIVITKPKLIISIKSTRSETTISQYFKIN